MPNKIYIVAGGSSGIGLGVTRSLAKRGNVIVYSRNAGPVANLTNVEHRYLDVMNENWNTGDLPEQIDGVVYCPGTINLKPFRRISEKEMIDDFRINVTGAFRLIQQVYPNLRKSPEASIVLFSTVAVQTGMSFHSSVAASKGAVEGLVRSLAAEFAPRIRVNAVAPSLTDTRLAEPLLSNDKKRENSANMHPLKRVGIADDQVNAVKFLLSHEASWITGQIIHVDGGISAVRG